MIITKDNVKVGDKLWIVCRDTRQRPYWFEVGSIGRKYITDIYGHKKIEIGTNEVYHKDGIGSTEYVYANEEEYAERTRMNGVRKDFWWEMDKYRTSDITEEDMNAIREILNKYKRTTF